MHRTISDEWPHRIAVRGTTGSGKSTFARELATKLDLPVIELDAQYWQENWKSKDKSEFQSNITEIASEERWVIDGNYSKYRASIESRVQLTIWLDYSFAFTFWQLFKRTLRRCCTRELLWGHSRERFWTWFHPKHSILIWCIKTHGTNHRRALAAESSATEHQPVLRFTQQSQAVIWLSDIPLTSRP